MNIHIQAGFIHAASAADASDPTTCALDVGDRLRAEARRLSDASWRLDSAASLVRKAKLGYRANPLIGDAAWNVGAAEAVYNQALADATAILGGIYHGA